MAQPAAASSNEAVQGTASSRDFYVVGIGASAGGLAALRALFSRIPSESGAAWVVVVHLSPQHESLLAPLLQPYSTIPVEQVKQTLALQPNHAYVIPPNANLTAIDSHLRLTELEPRRVERAPIDHFMRTLAATHDGMSAGVVLTGAGSDGALGLRLIKEHGGLTVAQDPVEAEFDSMPRSAIATGTVDFVLPIAEMVDEILRFCATRPQLPVVGPTGQLRAEDQALVDVLLGEVRVRTGHDLSMYTPAVLLPRVGRRMKLRQVDTLEQYIRLLRERPDEAEALRADTLLSVAEFFQDAPLYETLATRTLPDLFDHLDNHRMRAWSIGCSSGEEAYSLAMLMFEEAGRRAMRPEVRVFASDISDPMLSRAREGIYPKEVAATVSAERLERFFVAETSHFRIHPGLRNAVVFASHDVFRDAPYTHLDLIMCRRLLSELRPEMRQALIVLFHYALRPGAALIVGEHDVIENEALFGRDAHGTGIYRRRLGPARLLDMPLSSSASHGSLSAPDRARQMANRETLANVHRQAMVRYTPPSLLVDERDEIVHYSAGAGAYLQIPGGTLTHNLRRLARSPLRGPLMTALAEARRHDVFVSAPVSVGARRVRVRTERLAATPVARPLVLVVFEELPTASAAEAIVPASVAARVQELEAEVAEAHRKLAALLADEHHHEAESGASARPRYEELQMSAVLEEFQTSKEELQSINEELLTLDADNRQRLADLKRLSTDLQHLLQSTGMATIFLDRQQRIVRYTPQACELFRIQPNDVGRPLSDLYTSLLYREVAEDTHRVLTTGTPVEREVPERDGRWFMVRLHPYRTPDTIDGVVLTLVDVTARKRAELALRDIDRRKDEFLAVLAHELRNPLAPISAGVEVLRRSGDDPRTVASVAAMMDRQSRQLVRLVDDLLDAARIAGGRLQLRLGPVDVDTVVKDATAMVAPLIERGRQTLTIEVSDEPMAVQADTARLTQVIANILTNAANYTPPEGRITLTVTRAGAAAVFTISDTGQGMSPEVLEHLFDMYFQGSASPHVRTKGLGIGLAIAKQLVEMQGGVIAAASNGAGAGSVFTVSLPLLPDANLRSREDEGVPVHQASRRVLVVDDNADAAQSLSLLLATMQGIVVRIALSGRDALDIGADFKPQVVLLDLGMPGMDGYEVARLVRETPWGKDALLVAVTGWGQIEHRERAKAAGIDEHLTKPVGSETLEAILIESEQRTNDRP